MSKVIVVNREDEIVDYRDRNDWNTSDIIRVAALWIYNSENQVLIAQRSLNKVRSPGLWAMSVAGTVEEGENYESNIIKETEEEVGLTIKAEDLVLAPKNFIDVEHAYFVQMYFLKLDFPVTDFNPRVGEVEQVKWISLEELSTWFADRPQDFTPAFKYCLADYINFLKNKES